MGEKITMSVKERDKPFYLVFWASVLLLVFVMLAVFIVLAGGIEIDVNNILTGVIFGIMGVVIMGFTKYFDKEKKGE